MDLYDAGTVQHYSMWLSCKNTPITEKEQILYCDAIYYVRLLWFNKNHKLETYFFSSKVSSFSLFLCLLPHPPPPLDSIMCEYGGGVGWGGGIFPHILYE